MLTSKLFEPLLFADGLTGFSVVALAKFPAIYLSGIF
jgi:hypothetical protein